jgi:hypothetical protein
MNIFMKEVKICPKHQFDILRVSESRVSNKSMDLEYFFNLNFNLNKIKKRRFNIVRLTKFLLNENEKNSTNENKK